MNATKLGAVLVGGLVMATATQCTTGRENSREASPTTIDRSPGETWTNTERYDGGAEPRRSEDAGAAARSAARPSDAGSSPPRTAPSTTGAPSTVASQPFPDPVPAPFPGRTSPRDRDLPGIPDAGATPLQPR